jgi:hypothetical protein
MNKITFNKTKLFKKIILATLCWSVILLPSFLRADIISNAGEPVVGGEIVYIPFDDSVCPVGDLKNNYNTTNNKVEVGCVLLEVDDLGQGVVQKIFCENCAVAKQALFIQTDENGLGSFEMPVGLVNDCSGRLLTLYNGSNVYKLYSTSEDNRIDSSSGFWEVMFLFAKEIFFNIFSFLDFNSWAQDIIFEVEKSDLRDYNLVLPVKENSSVDSFYAAQLDALSSIALAKIVTEKREEVIEIFNLDEFKNFHEKFSSDHSGLFWLSYKFYSYFFSGLIETTIKDSYYLVNQLFDEAVFIDPVTRWEESKRQKKLIAAIKGIVTGPAGKSVVAYINNPRETGADFYNQISASYYNNSEANFSTDLAVNIIGFNDAWPIDKFHSQPPQPGAFIVKTSLGSSFGDQGYLYISYYDKGLAQNTFNYFLPENQGDKVNDSWPFVAASKEYKVYNDKIVAKLLTDDWDFNQPDLTKIGFWVSFPETKVIVKDSLGKILFQKTFTNPGYRQGEFFKPVFAQEMANIVIEFAGSKVQNFISSNNLVEKTFILNEEESFTSDEYNDFYSKFEFVPYLNFNSTQVNTESSEFQLVEIIKQKGKNLDEIFKNPVVEFLFEMDERMGYINSLQKGDDWRLQELWEMQLALRSYSYVPSDHERVVTENSYYPKDSFLVLLPNVLKGKIEVNGGGVNLDDLSKNEDLGLSTIYPGVLSYEAGNYSMNYYPSIGGFTLLFPKEVAPKVKVKVMMESSNKKRGFASRSDDNFLLAGVLTVSSNAVFPKVPEVCYKDSCLLQAEIINSSTDLVEVKAYVSRGQNSYVQEVFLLDNGSCGDKVANDSIYSAYYTGKRLEIGYNYLVRIEAEFKEVDSGTIKKQIGFPSNFYVINPARDLVTKEISLTPGWNMVSLPVDPLNYNDLEDRSVKKASAVFPEAKSVWEYHHVYNEFLQRRESKYISVLDESSGVDKEVHLGGGYFVYMDMDSSLKISVSGLICSGYLADLHPGWNLIGTISQENEVSKKAFEMFSMVDLVYDYDPEIKQYHLLSNGEVNEYLTEGRAVWVRVESEGSEKVIISN